MMSRIKSSITLFRVDKLFLFFVFIAYLPLFFISEWGFWDGVIVNSALLDGELGSLRYWFYSAGWHLQYWLYFLVYYIHVVSTVSIGIVISLLYIAFALVAYYSLSSLFIYLGYGLISSYAASAAFLLFPPFNLVASSVFLMHFSSIALFLLSVSFLVRRKYLFFSSLALILSFALNSLLVYAVIVAAALLYYGVRFNVRLYVYSSFMVVVLVLVYFTIKITYMAPYGLYEGYNSISYKGLLYALSYVPYLNILENDMFSYSWIYLIMLLFLSLMLFKSKISHEKELFTSGEMVNIVRQFFLIAILFIAAYFPYLLVGKPSNYQSDIWSQRQLFVISVAYSCMSLVVLASLFDFKLNYFIKYHRYELRKYFFLLSCLLLLPNFLLVLSSNYSWFYRYKQDEKLVAMLSSLNIEKGSYLELQVDGGNRKYRPYEKNYIYNKAFGKGYVADYYFHSYNNQSRNPDYIKMHLYEYFVHNGRCFKIAFNVTNNLFAEGKINYLQDVYTYLTTTAHYSDIDLVVSQYFKCGP